MKVQLGPERVAANPLERRTLAGEQHVAPRRELRIEDRGAGAVGGHYLGRIFRPEHDLAFFQRAEELHRPQRTCCAFAVGKLRDIADRIEVCLAGPDAMRHSV